MLAKQPRSGVELDAPELESAAPDALGGLAMVVYDWSEALQFARKRLGFEDRIGLYERLDAHSVFSWMSLVMGDLDTADRDSAEMVARLLPGQAPYPGLHLFAWRTLTLTLLGRWDEAVAMFWRALEAWNAAEPLPPAMDCEVSCAWSTLAAHAEMRGCRCRSRGDPLSIVNRFPSGAPASTSKGVSPMAMPGFTVDDPTIRLVYPPEMAEDAWPQPATTDKRCPPTSSTCC